MMKLALTVVIFAVACSSSQQQEHSSILNQKRSAVRVIAVSPSGSPLSGQDAVLTEPVECKTEPCEPTVVWSHKSGPNGDVTIPKNLIHPTTLLRVGNSEALQLQSARWQQDRAGWVIKLMGHPATVCSRYDTDATILVSDDWRSARVDQSELGLMNCSEAKDAFRTCEGPQMSDAGLTAIFTRAGDHISVRLSAETIAGPRDIGRLDCYRMGAGQPIPQDLTQWALEYSIAGGQPALNRHLRLTQAGEMNVSANSPDLGSHIDGHASDDVVSKVKAFLKAAHPAAPRSSHLRPEALERSAALIAGGARYDVALPADAAQLLDGAIDTTLRNALIGSWWESGWKLCHPVPTLAADQMDATIEQLVFQDDSRFAVTWQGGGARMYGDPSGKVPHVSVPDYSGQYAIQPDRSHIHMTFGSGIYTPRDFAGDGSFQLNGGKLTLRNMWLGTYKAKQKPDICEMTFTRSGEAQAGASAQKQ